MSADPTSWSEADALLGSRDSHKIRHNTILHRLDNGDIAVRLHNTDVVTFRQSGRVRFDTGGWRTVTTKERINRYAPRGVRVNQERGEWFLTDRNGKRRKFSDGITS